jgi:hypothetical protein
MRLLDEIERQILSWPEVSAHPHRFGGREFQFREIGHIHSQGIVDIPFPHPVRDALLEERLAEEHHWVPNSGWIIYKVRNEEDLNYALGLMRLSYLRDELKTAANPAALLETVSEPLRFQPLAQISVRRLASESRETKSC